MSVFPSLVQARLGYTAYDNDCEMSLVYLVMLVPLVFSGARRLSADHLIARKLGIR